MFQEFDTINQINSAAQYRQLEKIAADLAATAESLRLQSQAVNDAVHRKNVVGWFGAITGVLALVISAAGVIIQYLTFAGALGR